MNEREILEVLSDPMKTSINKLFDEIIEGNEMANFYLPTYRIMIDEIADSSVAIKFNFRVKHKYQNIPGTFIDLTIQISFQGEILNYFFWHRCSTIREMYADVLKFVDETDFSFCDLF